VYHKINSNRYPLCSYRCFVWQVATNFEYSEAGANNLDSGFEGVQLGANNVDYFINITIRNSLNNNNQG